MEAIYTAVAVSEGGRNGKVRTSDGLLDFEVRSPHAMGGPEGDKYTNPEQLFAAGYAACFGSALAHVALQKKIRLTPKVTASVSIGRNDKGGFQLAVVMETEIQGMSQKEAEELTAQAHQVCPYSNATRGNIEVTLKTTVVP